MPSSSISVEAATVHRTRQSRPSLLLNDSPPDTGPDYGPLPHGEMRCNILPHPVERMNIKSTDLSFEKNATRALYMTREEALENPKFVRTFHPAFSSRNEVILVEEPEPIWIVVGQPVEETTVTGMNVHVRPELHHVLSARMGSPQAFDPIEENIDPRHFLRSHHIPLIRKLFPSAIGARLLRTGFLCILFASRSDPAFKKSTQFPPTFGGLRVSLEVSYHEVSTVSTTATNKVVCSRYGITGVRRSPTDPRSLEPKEACLGLKLIYEGKEVTAVPTHAFVTTYKHPANPFIDRIALKFHDLILTLQEKLQESAFVQKIRPLAAIVPQPTYTANTPIGKEVWLSRYGRKIGTITHTFDPFISDKSPFPHGFAHDLSLVTNNDGLMELHSPENHPRIVAWAPYDRVMSGEPVYVCRQNITGEWRILEGKIMSDAMQSAVVEGSEYFWDRKSRHHRVALLWRTKHDFDTAKQYSGTALCLGTPHQKTSEVVVFQNYEARLRPQWITPNESGMDSNLNYCTFKGGFLLPLSIRQSEIAMDRDRFPEAPSTMPRTRQATSQAASLPRDGFSEPLDLYRYVNVGETLG